MSRAVRSALLLVVGLVAVVATLWLASPDRETAAARDADTVTSVQHVVGGVATLTTRAPLPCARAEQPRRDFGSLARSVAERQPPPAGNATPLYALHGAYRL